MCCILDRTVTNLQSFIPSCVCMLHVLDCGSSQELASANNLISLSFLPLCSCLVTMVGLRSALLGRLSLRPSLKLPRLLQQECNSKWKLSLSYFALWNLNSKCLWYYSAISELTYLVKHCYAWNYVTCVMGLHITCGSIWLGMCRICVWMLSFWIMLMCRVMVSCNGCIIVPIWLVYGLIIVPVLW